MKKSTTLAAVTVIAALFMGTVNAEEGKKGNKGEGKKHFSGSAEIKAYRAKQEKARKEYRKNRREENKAFHESMKDKSPAEALTAVITRRKTLYSETKTFMNGLYNEFVTYAKEVMVKNEVPSDKQSELLKKIEERRNEGVAKHQEIHDKLIDALENLKGKEDLTKEDIKKTVSDILPDRKRKGDRKGKKGRDEG